MNLHDWCRLIIVVRIWNFYVHSTDELVFFVFHLSGINLVHCYLSARLRCSQCCLCHCCCYHYHCLTSTSSLLPACLNHPFVIITHSWHKQCHPRGHVPPLTKHSSYMLLCGLLLPSSFWLCILVSSVAKNLLVLPLPQSPMTTL